MRFPWSVYRGNSAWVPPLLSDFKKKLDTERNPFYHHAEIQPFLAWHGGTVVGTVAAIIDHEFNSFHDERTGFFGFSRPRTWWWWRARCWTPPATG